MRIRASRARGAHITCGSRTLSAVVARRGVPADAPAAGGNERMRPRRRPSGAMHLATQTALRKAAGRAYAVSSTPATLTLIHPGATATGARQGHVPAAAAEFRTWAQGVQQRFLDDRPRGAKKVGPHAPRPKA